MAASRRGADDYFLSESETAQLPPRVRLDDYYNRIDNAQTQRQTAGTPALAPASTNTAENTAATEISALDEILADECDDGGNYSLATSPQLAPIDAADDTLADSDLVGPGSIRRKQKHKPMTAAEQKETIEKLEARLALMPPSPKEMVSPTRGRHPSKTALELKAMKKAEQAEKREREKAEKVEKRARVKAEKVEKKRRMEAEKMEEKLRKKAESPAKKKKTQMTADEKAAEMRDNLHPYVKDIIALLQDDFSEENVEEIIEIAGSILNPQDGVVAMMEQLVAVRDQREEMLRYLERFGVLPIGAVE